MRGGGGMVDAGDETLAPYPLQRRAQAHARAGADFDDAVAGLWPERAERGPVLAPVLQRHGREGETP